MSMTILIWMLARLSCHVHTTAGKPKKHKVTNRILSFRNNKI